MNEYNYEAIFELLMKNSSNCEILVDLNGNISMFNKAFVDLTGYNEEEIKNKPNTFFTSESDLAKETSKMNTLLNGKKNDVKFVSAITNKDGNSVPVEVNAILFKDNEGKPNFIIKRIEDISERLQNEELNKNRFTLLQTILEEIPINMYFKDLESRFLMVSKSQIPFLGCSSFEEIEGKTDFDFFDEDHARDAYNDEQEIIRTGKSIVKEEREIHRDGSVTYALSTKSPLKDDDGNIIGTYGISKDITANKAAEEKTRLMNEELAIKNKKLEEAIEELSRTQNKLIFAEKMAALGNLIGGIAHEINTPLGAIKASSTNINEVVQKINLELPWLINNASNEELNWLFRLLNEADARDISVFSREERQKKRELTSLLEQNNIANAATIADTIVSLKLNLENEKYLEFMTMPNSQRLLQMLKVLFSLKRNSNNIFISVDKASKVVRALKSYIYKNSAGDFEATDIVETITTVLILTANMIKHTKTEITTQFETIPFVFCKQDEICQVWTNIITNAMQAMGEGGKLEIGTKIIDNNIIKIWFKDNGPGIPEKIQERIFEPYFTTKEKGVGTGMGLDISRQIIDHHHGKLYFDSKPGQGTTFIVEIPLNQDVQKN